jgi:predicted HTH transcriptional regulator
LLPSDIVIKIFDDRIVFTNPGKLYGKLRIEDLQRNDYVSSIRNRLLAEAFFLMVSGDVSTLLLTHSDLLYRLNRVD